MLVSKCKSLYRIFSNSAPYPVMYFFNLIVDVDSTPGYLVCHSIMAAISNWYLTFTELLIPERNKVCAIVF